MISDNCVCTLSSHHSFVLINEDARNNTIEEQSADSEPTTRGLLAEGSMWDINV